MNPATTRLTLGTPDDGPYALTIDHRGRLWTTMVRSGRLCRVTPADATSDPTPPQIRFVDLGRADSAPSQLALAPDGGLWCTRMGDDHLDRIDTDSGHRRSVALPPGTQPYGLTIGPDGAIWFTAIGAEAIGRVHDDGTVSSIKLPEPGMPSMITTGADGGLWFTVHHRGVVARLNPANHTIVEHHLADPDGDPVGLAADPNGLWCAQIRAGRIARVHYDGTSTEHDLPDRAAQPHAVTAAPGGGCWVSLWGTSGVVRIHPDRTATPWAVLHPDDHPHGLLLAGSTLWVATDRGDLVAIGT